MSEPLVETMEVMRREEESAQTRFTLLAVGAGRESLAEVIAAAGEERIFVAMDNCPRQTVVVGPPEPMAAVEAELAEAGASVLAPAGLPF